MSELQAAAELIRSKWATRPIGSLPTDLFIAAKQLAEDYLAKQQLWEQLQGYLKHRVDCPASVRMWMKNQAGPCTCGLDPLLEQAGLNSHE